MFLRKFGMRFEQRGDVLIARYSDIEVEITIPLFGMKSFQFPTRIIFPKYYEWIGETKIMCIRMIPERLHWENRRYTWREGVMVRASSTERLLIREGCQLALYEIWKRIHERTGLRYIFEIHTQKNNLRVPAYNALYHQSLIFGPSLLCVDGHEIKRATIRLRANALFEHNVYAPDDLSGDIPEDWITPDGRWSHFRYEYMARNNLDEFVSN